ncbi:MULTISPECIES: nucleotidyl transferase AbiEii/AbiGii toxin family protein [Mycolicibacterium]|uniref:Nucleotidyl transferase AbiEii/AbiGii toxin family protein n=1 Tax=Mycolicibacterium nivoides TaxID=2487344 RepID=A0ABW9LP88_9MYCO|nr:nucleotidyl transferase AbiEii/AbiGii toxin family protein [Mycolicibacterium fortuitum]
MSASSAGERPVWTINSPPGGWPPPWPQLVEIVQAIPHTQWTLVGGLMVQLHAVYAGLALTRPTRDVDMILHIETGAATFSGVRDELERLGYALREPLGEGPVHRFVRGPDDAETVDVMVADRLPPKWHPKVLRRTVFAVPGGTSALRKTVNCEVDTGEVVVTLSVPDVLGALVLKGAAYIEDTRDRGRHLDDAAVLACAATDPVGDRARMIGNDRRRIAALWKALQDESHRSWLATGGNARRGRAALRVLVGD